MRKVPVLHVMIISLPHYSIDPHIILYCCPRESVDVVSQVLQTSVPRATRVAARQDLDLSAVVNPSVA